MESLRVRKANGIPAGTATLKQLKIGAGGFSPTIKFALDGTLLTRTDVGSAYKFNPATQKWQPLCQPSRLPTGFATLMDLWEGTGTYIDGWGCFEIAIAPQDSTYIVMFFAGYLYLSTNGGTSFSKCAGWTRKPALANTGQQRLSSDKIAIDPANKNYWYVATTTQLWKTTDGGATFTQVSAVPAAAGPAPCLIVAIDASSTAAAGGQKNIVHAFSSNSGAYRSADGGVTWAQTKAETTGLMPEVMRIDSTGKVYVSLMNISTGACTFLRYSGGAWTTLSGVNGLIQDVACFAIDPSNNNRIIIMSGAGYAQMSTDGGASWSGGSIWYAPMWLGFVHGGDVPWLIAEVNRRNFLAISDIRFHPITGELWAAMGVGVIHCTFPAAYSSTAYLYWTIASAGIESLVTHHAVSIPGGPMVCLAEDRPVYVSNSPDTYPADYYDSSVTLADGFDADYASDDPNYIAVLCNLNATVPGYSLDKGATFHPFAATPATALGGGIAVSSKAKICVFPGQNGLPRFTANGGTSWANCTFPSNVPTSGETGWQFGYIDNKRHIITADKAAGDGIFYAYNYGPGGSTTIAGIYKSTDGGANFTRIAASPVSNLYTGYHAVLRAVPGNAGHLFFACGPVGNVNSEQTGCPFVRSLDGGITWTSVAGNLSTGAAVVSMNEGVFSFGATAPGASYPSIYFLGWLNGTYGIYRSDDNCATWLALPLPNITDEISCICADLNNYGCYAIGTTGNGWIYGSYNCQFAVS
jgi:photosystem II stability/assembly factor-like uncharacterized protein